MIPKTAPTGSPALVRAATLTLLGLAAGVASSPALGGSVLVSRESGLRASGASAAGEYNLSNGSGDFDAFTDNIHSDDAASAARSMAQQHSMPRLDGSGAFGGAMAKGTVRAAVDASASDAFSSAESDFDLVFRVTGEPARVLLQCSMDAAGDGTAGLKLYDVQTLNHTFADEVSGDSREFSGEEVLKPGVYGLSVWAFVRGTPADSTATYDINLSLAAGAAEEPPPVVTPMPLPSGAWTGLATMLVVGGTAMRVRRRPAR
jgi:hypothetical protein